MGAIIIIVAALFLSGCLGESDPVAPQSSADNYRVGKLFTVDGCTVYRFYDGDAHYFTNCHGNTETNRTVYCGKGCLRRPPGAQSGDAMKKMNSTH